MTPESAAYLAKAERALDEARLAPGLSAFLARAYMRKTAADYAIGETMGITSCEAGEAINEAVAFVEDVCKALQEDDASPPT